MRDNRQNMRKNDMRELKKTLCAVITILMVIILGMWRPITAFAAEDMTGLVATHNGTSVAVTGTLTNISVSAVSIMIIDDTNTLVGMMSGTADTTSHIFSVTFTGLTLTTGKTYTVKAANFDGGDFSVTTFVAVAPPTPAPASNDDDDTPAATPTPMPTPTPAPAATTKQAVTKATPAPSATPKPQERDDSQTKKDESTKEDSKTDDTKNDTSITDDNGSKDLVDVSVSANTEGISGSAKSFDPSYLWFLLLIPVAAVIIVVIRASFKNKDN